MLTIYFKDNFAYFRSLGDEITVNNKHPLKITPRILRTTFCLARTISTTSSSEGISGVIVILSIQSSVWNGVILGLSITNSVDVIDVLFVMVLLQRDL